MLRYFQFYKLFLILLFISFLLIFSIFLILPQKTVVKSEIEISNLIDNKIFNISINEILGTSIFDAENTFPFYNSKNFEGSLLKELKSIENIIEASDKKNLYNSELFITLMQQSFYIEDGYLFFKYSSSVDTDIGLIVSTYKNLLSNTLIKSYEQIKTLNDNFLTNNLSIKEFIIDYEKNINETNENIEWLKTLKKEKNISNNFFYENVYLLNNELKKFNKIINQLNLYLVQNEKNYEYVKKQIKQPKINYDDIPIVTSYSFQNKKIISIYSLFISFVISFMLIVMYDIILRDFLKK